MTLVLTHTTDPMISWQTSNSLDIPKCLLNCLYLFLTSVNTCFHSFRVTWMNEWKPCCNESRGTAAIKHHKLRNHSSCHSRYIKPCSHFIMAALNFEPPSITLRIFVINLEEEPVRAARLTCVLRIISLLTGVSGSVSSCASDLKTKWAEYQILVTTLCHALVAFEMTQIASSTDMT